MLCCIRWARFYGTSFASWRIAGGKRVRACGYRHPLGTPATDAASAGKPVFVHPPGDRGAAVCGLYGELSSGHRSGLN